MYVEKRRVLIEQKVREGRSQLLRENIAANLIIEAMDEKDLDQASQIIDKLRSMKGKGLDALDRGIEQAESELNKYTAGGPISKAWSKMKGKMGIDNPLVKVMTMANALEQGFKQLPMILKNVVGSQEDLYKNSGKSIAELVPDETKQKIILKNIMKALSPSGVFGAFKKIPYVDMSALAPALLAVEIGDLAPLIKTITSGPSTQRIADDIKDTATAGGEAETKNTSQSEPAHGSSGTEGTSPTKDTTKTTGSVKAGEAPGRPTPKETLSDEQVLKIARAINVSNDEDIVAALKLLNDKGHLKM
ncbi:MAG: hypothetical protein WC761_07020 [Candidatus Paceibacterota bacterium]|jgi:hypothetical protein